MVSKHSCMGCRRHSYSVLHPSLAQFIFGYYPHHPSTAPFLTSPLCYQYHPYHVSYHLSTMQIPNVEIAQSACIHSGILGGLLSKCDTGHDRIRCFGYNIAGAGCLPSVRNGISISIGRCGIGHVL